ncbi:MAG: restriction endonuclease subunit S [Nitrospira sp. SB0675_bin_23]|nr:restriction endonuclease subunit S [Nitrospira sp. SB0667_bin_9]MYD30856.1 restriction endonuclease subunit S [Nitrospira sp. SB0661_bin_20]MYH01561.1 restriction endonuclease subunit S [Nitrospira sp. SB0675_bin_23]MYJ23949.1 restriction endonuclease subunit S [Nitrospira sp. SB0673_bin_12]
MNQAWSWCPLGELFEIGAGKTMSAAARNGTDKTPFLRTSNVLWDEIDLSSVDEMSIPEHERLAKLLRTGDLLVCEGGEIGRAAIWNGEVETMSFQNHLHRLRPILEEVEPRFYVYFLQSAFTQLGIFEGTGNKTTIPNLSRSRLANFRVPQPTLDEQQAIVAVLAKIRDAIKIHEQSIALALDLKRVTMRTLCTHGLRGRSTKETEIGPVPESWELVTIGKVFKIEQGLSLKGNLASDGHGRPFLRTSNVYWGRIELQSVSRMRLAGATPANKLLRRGDLLVCEGGEIGRAATWNGEIEECLFQNHLHRLCPLDASRTHAQFVMAWLEEGFKHRKVYEGTGNRTTIPNLSRARLAEILIPHPPPNEQREIVAILNAIDRKIDLHRRKRAVLEGLFKALLHKLMTGEIRVVELDCSALQLAHVSSLELNGTDVK